MRPLLLPARCRYVCEMKYVNFRETGLNNRMLLCVWSEIKVNILFIFMRACCTENKIFAMDVATMRRTNSSKNIHCVRDISLLRRKSYRELWETGYYKGYYYEHNLLRHISLMSTISYEWRFTSIQIEAITSQTECAETKTWQVNAHNVWAR